MLLAFRELFQSKMTYPKTNLLIQGVFMGFWGALLSLVVNQLAVSVHLALSHFINGRVQNMEMTIPIS